MNTIAQNKKAKFEFHVLDKFVAGIQLFGTEIKSIRNGDVSIAESYCYINNGEVFLRNSYIKEYEFASHKTHDTRRERKLLLNKKEINKMRKAVEAKGVTIVPLKLFINNKGLAKLEIGIAKGKKLYDKRQSIKERDIKRDMDRDIKY